MTDILETIAAYKREDVSQRRKTHSLSDLEARIQSAGAPRGFAQALKANKRPGSLSLIAEIKKPAPLKA